MLFLSTLALSGLLVPGVLSKKTMGATEWEQPEGGPPTKPLPINPSPEQFSWNDNGLTGYEDLEAISFVPFDEFSESKQPIVLAKDLLAKVIRPEHHNFIDPAVLCHGNLDDHVVCSQSIPHDQPKLEARIDRKGCLKCFFYAGDCSRCPLIDGTTESCSSPDSASDDSEKDCAPKHH